MSDDDIMEKLDRLEAAFTNVFGDKGGAKGAKTKKGTGSRLADYEDAPGRVRPPVFTPTITGFPGLFVGDVSQQIAVGIVHSPEQLASSRHTPVNGIYDTEVARCNVSMISSLPAQTPLELLVLTVTICEITRLRADVTLRFNC